MLKLCVTLTRLSRAGVANQTIIRFNNFSSAVPTPQANVEGEGGSDKQTSNKNNDYMNMSFTNTIVAAAFAALKHDKDLPNPEISTPLTDQRIAEATNINQLLSISDGTGVSQRHALKVMSILADWMGSGKIQQWQFESDSRFIRLCKILTRGNYGQKVKVPPTVNSEDLSTVLNITADDEAAKLITSLTSSQMVKVLTTLGHKKRRSTPLLRSLACNLTRSSDVLDIKQCADVLYGSAILNFADINLLNKIGVDICESIEKLQPQKGSAAINSILTSLGVLRYKDLGVLDAIITWAIKNHQHCRSTDAHNLFFTLAVLNYHTGLAQLHEIFKSKLTEIETLNSRTWLNLVWSLVLLDKASPQQISSVLSQDFLNKLEESSFSFSQKQKLLNIDCACELLIQKYNGPRLEKDSALKQLGVVRSKEKEILVKVVLDSLENLLDAQKHLKTVVNTGLGFCIDAVCLFNKNGNPIPHQTELTAEDLRKVAIVVHDYHDMCRGRPDPSGINAFYGRLLEARGYHVLTVPYTEFNPRDKLVTRVRYMEGKLKSVTTQT